MGGKNRPKHPFDNRSGILIFPISVIQSRNYQTMYQYSQRLMPLMQVHWREEKPVAFGVGEAMELLDCDKRTAMKAFRVLQDRGFIIKIDESIFNSRKQSRARTWRLTWMPFNWQSPTLEWEKWPN